MRIRKVREAVRIAIWGVGMWVGQCRHKNED
jgi:hypothetical protein